MQYIYALIILVMSSIPSALAAPLDNVVECHQYYFTGRLSENLKEKPILKTFDSHGQTILLSLKLDPPSVLMAIKLRGREVEVLARIQSKIDSSRYLASVTDIAPVTPIGLGSKNGFQRPREVPEKNPNCSYSK